MNDFEYLDRKNKDSQTINSIYKCNEYDLAEIIDNIYTLFWEENVRLLTNGFCEDMSINYENKIIDYGGYIYRLSDEQFVEVIETLNKAIESPKEDNRDDYCKYIYNEIVYFETREMS